MATKEKIEKTGEEKQVDCVAAELRILKDRVERMQANWRKFAAMYIGTPSIGKKTGEVGAVGIRHIVGVLAASAAAAVLVWASGEVDNKTVGSGTYRLDQATSASPIVLVVDSVRAGVITNTGALALTGHLTAASGLEVTGGQTNTGALTVTGNATLGDDKVSDSHTVNGPTTINGAVTIKATNSTSTIFSVDNAGDAIVKGTTVSSSKDTGSLIVDGGAGVEEDVYAGGQIVAGAAILATTTLGCNGAATLGDDKVLDSHTVNGPTTINGAVTVKATNSTDTIFSVDNSGNAIVKAATVSSSKDTGALIVEGGVGAEEDVYAGGQIVAAAAISAGTTFGCNGNATIGDDKVLDSHTINGPTTLNGALTVKATNSANTVFAVDNAGTVTGIPGAIGSGLIAQTGGITNTAAKFATLEITDSVTAPGTFTNIVTGNLSCTGNGTFGDDPVKDSHILNGLTTIKGEITLTSTNLTYTNTVDSTAVGTVMIGRPTSGTVLITSKDDTADAALTVAAGGTGTTTLGDADSATTITGTSVNLLKGSTVGSLAAVVASDTTALLVQHYLITADASHTVYTNTLTTAYGDGVEPAVCVTYRESGGAAIPFYTATSNTVTVTLTADKDASVIVVGARP